MASGDLPVNRGCAIFLWGGGSVPAERTRGLLSGAEAASNPSCRGGGSGGLSRSGGGGLHLIMSQARQNLTVSQSPVC